MSPNQITALIVSCILIVVSFISWYQGLDIAADRVFICLIYCSLLITFYFTYSVKVAGKMIDKQIQLVVTDMAAVRDTLNIPKTDLPPSHPTSDNLKIKNRNRHIWHRSKILIGICLILSFTLSGAIWMYKNKHHNFFNIKKYSKEIIFKNIIILLSVLIIQFLFSTIFIGNMLPLDSHEILKTVLVSSLND